VRVSGAITMRFERERSPAVRGVKRSGTRIPFVEG
jgi:hypothetical protein